MDDDLAPLFGEPPEPPSQDVRFRQGLIITFNKDTLENTVDVGGTIFTNLKVLSSGEVRLLVAGAVVEIVVVGSSTKTMYITGRILKPGTPEAASAVIPGTPGTVASFAGSGSPPVGWLVCNGAAVSRATYADLFAAIGTLWGVGDGSTTFNLPDLRDRVFIGAGATYSVGNTGGATTHTHGHSGTHTHGHSATHTHTSAGTDSGGSHTHSIPQGTDSTFGATNGAIFVSAQAHTHGGTNSGGSHSHSVSGSTGSTAPGTSDSASPGTSDSANGLPPYAALTPIIRY